MALITCGECNGQVSDQAATCPHCGAPVASARETSAAGQPLTTIQQTSKKFKLQTLLSISLVLFGLLFLWAESSSGQDGTIGGSLAAIGLSWYLITRIRSWWHHS